MFGRAGPKEAVHTPLLAGVAISAATHADYGTLGAIVLGGAPMILTNKHVANDDEANPQIAENLKLIVQRAANGKKVFDDETVEMIKAGNLPIFQPPYAGGENKSARVVAWVTKASGVSDAAVCTLAKGVDYSMFVRCEPLFTIPGILPPKVGQLVLKSGAATGVTYGVVTDISGENIIIRHPYHDVLPFAKGAGPFVQGVIGAHGDSGAVWVDASSYAAVGLLHKGKSDAKNNYSVASRMDVVAKKLAFVFKA